MRRDGDRPATEAETRVVQRGPVHWLSPRELGRAGLRVLLSGVFGEYADKREVMAALPTEYYDVSERDGAPVADLWFDYVSDLGDGFDATYAVATLLAQESLPLGDDGAPLPRGAFLVMGGDEVYPVASPEAYETRTTRPYRAALPVRGEDSPALFAVPGNHDWYDGLSSFQRVFCQSWIDDPGVGDDAPLRRVDPATRTRDFVGGWRTQQARSYFAVKLPHDWWLWAVDIQFDNYIDGPQLAYFHAVAAELGEGSQVVLCTAKPSWTEEDADSYDTLDFFVGDVLGSSPATVRVMLSGDQHHYARYTATSADGDHAQELITCGGGGAYLSATHDLPGSLTVPPDDRRRTWRGPDPATYRLAATSPGQRESAALARGAWRIPARNPGLVALLGVVCALLVWAFVAATPGPDGGGLTQRLSDLTVGAVALAPLRLPALVLTVLVLLAAVGFTAARGVRRWLVGLLHGALHVVLALGLAVALAAVPGWDSWPSWLSAAVATVVAVAVGGLLSALLLSAYLLVATTWGAHHGELFAGLRIEHHKSFLRVHVDADGLTIWAVGLEHVPHRWEFVADAPTDAPWFRPDRPLQPRLVDQVVRVPPARRA